MLARFFIDRPIFAWVISIVIVLLGAVAAMVLPVAQYPDITPPTVTVSASYPGASVGDVSGNRHQRIGVSRQCRQFVQLHRADGGAPGTHAGR